jgi:hypothetical protein
MVSKRPNHAIHKPVHRYSLRSKGKLEQHTSEDSSHGSPSRELTPATNEPAIPPPCIKTPNTFLADITSQILNTPEGKSEVTTPKTPKSVRLQLFRKGVVLPEQATEQKPSKLSLSNSWDKTELDALGVTLDEHDFNLNEVHGDINKQWSADVENCTFLNNSCLTFRVQCCFTMSKWIR